MAEENNLENELDENLAETTEVDLPNDIDSENSVNNVQEDTKTSSVLDRIKNIPSIILSSRRNMIIAGLVIVILAVGSFFLISSGGNDDLANQLIESEMQRRKNIVD